MKRFFWIIVAVLSAIYIFVPEPTDVVPILGWLDEATAIAILTFALKKLNITFFDKFFKQKKKDGKTIIIDPDK